MNPLKKIIPPLLLIIALVLTILAVYKVKEFMAIDSCLDRGGAWLYETNQCEYIPAFKRDSN
jgi:hypothetical protein